MVDSANKPNGFFVHETAVVDEGVAIGNGTKIWHFSHLLQGTEIGPDCVIGQNVMIGPDVQIGAKCKIQNNVSLYNGVTLEDDVFIGPSVVFTNVKTPRAFIERKDQFEGTIIKQGASIGANATILCGVTLGNYCLVGAGAVVNKSVPDFALVYGAPAVHKGWVSKAGCVLDDTLICPHDGSCYEVVDGKLIMVSGLFQTS